LSGFDCNKVRTKTNGDRCYAIQNFFHIFYLERYSKIFKDLQAALRAA
jgi:hypothetical protein